MSVTRAPLVAGVISVLLLAGAGARFLARNAADEALAQRLDEAETTVERLRDVESEQFEREVKNCRGQSDEIDNVLPADESDVARSMARDLWISGFTLTSLSEADTKGLDFVVQHHFNAAVHAGRVTWMDALDALGNRGIRSVTGARVRDPANPDATVELELVTWVRRD